MTPSTFAFLTVASAISVAAFAQTATLLPAGSKALEIVQTSEVQFPRVLERAGLMRGEAWIVLNVDAAGQLQDVLVAGYTRREFADEALAALKRWRYKPALVKGEALATVREVHFSFSRSGVIVENLTGVDMIERYMDRRNNDQLRYRVRALHELDQIPLPIKMVQPEFPDSLAAAGVSGSVTIEFYIDEEGRVRLPAVLDWAKPELAQRAEAAVRAWQFEPPTSQGRPALVLARQEFCFTP